MTESTKVSLASFEARLFSWSSSKANPQVVGLYLLRRITVGEIVEGIIIISSCIIVAWSIVAGILACLMGGLMMFVGDHDQDVDDALGEGHYARLFGVGAGIPAFTALIAMEAAYTYNVSSNTAWIFWFCTWGYGFWCIFREIQVIYRVRRAHRLSKQALRGA